MVLSLQRGASPSTLKGDFEMLFPKRVLKRALALVSKEECRFYLKGVHVVCAPNSQGAFHVRVEATDGHMAYVWGAAVGENGVVADNGKEAQAFDVIVPSEFLKSALKAAGKRADRVDLSAQDMRVTVDTMSGQAIDGTFPELSRVIPRQTSGDTWEGQLGFNVHYLAKIAKVLETSALRIFANGYDQAALVRSDDDNELIVIMPMRNAGYLGAEDHSARIAAIYGEAPAADEKDLEAA